MKKRSFTRSCVIGFVTLFLCSICAVNGDYCKVNLCQNGGTCVTGIGQVPFLCICAEGFAGDTCNATESGPCSPNPCKNDGVCEVITNSRRGDVFNEYVCKCQPGFEGAHCQINDKNSCGCRSTDFHYCMISSYMTVSSYTLFHWAQAYKCRYNGTGVNNRHTQDVEQSVVVRENYNHDVNDCANKPCRNGGICRDLDGDYNCQCPSPYVGKQCQLRCTSQLGMEKGGIVESQISASSVHSGILGLQHWGPELARLNNQGVVNAWSSAPQDKSPWIQIDMQKNMRLTGIITQGASRMGIAEFIKAFKVASSFDGKTYTVYKSEGQRKDKVFMGNTDNDGTKTNMFDSPIAARYIRIIPVVCRKACTLRMELVGCELNVHSSIFSCTDPLGVKSRLISDTQLSASSAYRTWGIDAFTWHPYYARLDKQGKTNAWAAATNNRSEWLQLDLEKPKRVTGIITQGAKDFGVVQFVSAFKIAYSDDGHSWKIVQDQTTGKDKIFQGNIDNNTQKKNLVEPPFFAQFVRFLPWEWHERITLRMELLGCDD